MEAHNTDLNAPAWTVTFYQHKIKSQLYSLPKTTATVPRTSVHGSSSTLRTISSSISQLQRHSLSIELSATGKRRERSPGRDGSPTYLRPSKKRCRKHDNEYVIYFHSGDSLIKEPIQIDPAYDPPLGTTYIHEVEKDTIVAENLKEPQVQIWIRCKGVMGN
ncbi:hypothetical protein BC629DRAFT_1591512 [Irpex lacteus]|nr:hypothetical protein BC629DRAFT_1591512 [Irpex lacteus]